MPLIPLPSIGRAMIYAMPNGETVRIRTSNDHMLLVVGWTRAPGAKLNVDGTDWLLLVMPEVRRTLGRAICYLLPTREVEAEARRVREAWCARNRKTESNNRTFKLWFKKDSRTLASDYATKWSKYRLDVCVVTT